METDISHTVVKVTPTLLCLIQNVVQLVCRDISTLQNAKLNLHNIFSASIFK